ncbi:CHAT domain-containing protein [Nocardia heshunensis]
MARARRRMDAFERSHAIADLDRAIAIVEHAVTLETGSFLSILVLFLLRVGTAGHSATGNREYLRKVEVIATSVRSPSPLTVSAEQCREWSEIERTLSAWLSGPDRSMRDLEEAKTHALMAVAHSMAAGDHAAIRAAADSWLTVTRSTMQRTMYDVDILDAVDALHGLVTDPRFRELWEPLADLSQGCIWTVIGAAYLLLDCMICERYGVDGGPHMEEAISSCERGLKHFARAGQRTGEEAQCHFFLAQVWLIKYRRSGDSRYYDSAWSSLAVVRDLPFDPRSRVEADFTESVLHSFGALRCKDPDARQEDLERAVEAAERAYRGEGTDPARRWIQLVFATALSNADSTVAACPSAPKSLAPNEIQPFLGYISTIIELPTDPAVLDASIGLFERTVSETPEGTDERAVAELGLAQVLKWRSGGKYGSRVPIDRRLCLWEGILDDGRIAPVHRVSAGYEAGLACAFEGDWHRGLAVMTRTMSAAADLIDTSDYLGGRLRAMSPVSGNPVGLICLAAECAVRTGNEELALDLIDSGLGLIHKDAPDGLRDPRQVVATAGDPVVAVFDGVVTAYAIVVTSHGITSLELGVPLHDRAHPNEDDLTVMASRFFTATVVVDDDEMSTILEWLWATLVQPVLNHLRDAGVDPTHLYWLPVGPAAHLPLHAAGFHRDSSRRTLLDQCSSSYIAGLAILDRSSGRRGSRGMDGMTALTLVGPHLGNEATGTNPAELECAVVAEYLTATGCRVDMVVPPQATGARATHAVASVNIAHVICHGYADRAGGPSSALELCDGPLNVEELMRLRPNDLWLVYLSACFTAVPAILRSETPAHPAFAFHTQGAANVVATLWEIDNEHVTATTFYAALTDGSDPHAAWRHAVLTRRAQYSDAPSKWAALIHIG